VRKVPRIKNVPFSSLGIAVSRRVVINLLYHDLCISLLSMFLSCPAVNYSDAEKINHIGLRTTPEKPSDDMFCVLFSSAI